MDPQHRTPTVGIVILKGSQVLLVKHGERAGHMTGTYGLPGGRIDIGETPIQAVTRELEEETGMRVREEDLRELPQKYEVDLPRKNGETLSVHHTVFAAKHFHGELQGTDETSPEWVEIDSLKDIDLVINTENMVRQGIQILREV